jgi:hypothetical protein
MALAGVRACLSTLSRDLRPPGQANDAAAGTPRGDGGRVRLTGEAPVRGKHAVRAEHEAVRAEHEAVPRGQVCSRGA